MDSVSPTVSRLACYGRFAPIAIADTEPFGQIPETLAYLLTGGRKMQNLDMTELTFTFPVGGMAGES